MTVSTAQLKRAVINTLTYSDHFNYPLTKDELHARLIGHKLTQPKLLSVLGALLQSKEISKKGDYYFLPNKAELVKQRQIYNELSKPLLSHAKSLIPTLTVVSTIKAIYLTGSLAMSNTDGHDDIDLMIITSEGRLWTTRALLTLYTSLLSLRRTPKSTNNAGKLCLNLYLTPTALTMPRARQTIYTAYELIQALPLYDPDDTRASLLTSNSWAKKYLPNYPWPKSNKNIHPSNKKTNPLSNWLELFCYYIQYLYMKSKMTNEYVTIDSAYFHPHNPGKSALKKIQ